MEPVHAHFTTSAAVMCKIDGAESHQRSDKQQLSSLIPIDEEIDTLVTKQGRYLLCDCGQIIHPQPTRDFITTLCTDCWRIFPYIKDSVVCAKLTALKNNHNQTFNYLNRCAYIDQAMAILADTGRPLNDLAHCAVFAYWQGFQPATLSCSNCKETYKAHAPRYADDDAWGVWTHRFHSCKNQQPKARQVPTMVVLCLALIAVALQPVCVRADGWAEFIRDGRQDGVPLASAENDCYHVTETATFLVNYEFSSDPFIVGPGRLHATATISFVGNSDGVNPDGAYWQATLNNGATDRLNIASFRLVPSQLTAFVPQFLTSVTDQRVYIPDTYDDINVQIQGYIHGAGYLCWTLNWNWVEAYIDAMSFASPGLNVTYQVSGASAVNNITLNVPSPLNVSVQSVSAPLNVSVLNFPVVANTTEVSKVEVVGFARQCNPIWTSAENSGGPVVCASDLNPTTSPTPSPTTRTPTPIPTPFPTTNPTRQPTNQPSFKYPTASPSPSPTPAPTISSFDQKLALLRNKQQHALNGNIRGGSTAALRAQKTLIEPSNVQPAPPKYQRQSKRQLRQKDELIEGAQAVEGRAEPSVKLEDLDKYIADLTEHNLTIKHAYQYFTTNTWTHVNPYAVLFDEFDDGIEYESLRPDYRELADAKRRRPIKTTATEDLNKPKPTRPAEVKAREPVKDLTRGKTPEQLWEQRARAVERIVSRIKQLPEPEQEIALVDWVLDHKPLKRFSYDVITQFYNGVEWDSTASASMWVLANYYAPSVCNGLAVTWLLHLAGGNLEELLYTETYAQWYTQRFTGECPENYSALQKEADAINRNMHALMGNIIFASSMAEVKSYPSVTEAYTKQRSAKRVRPWEQIVELSTLPASFNPRVNSVYASMSFRGDLLNVDNTVSGSVQIPCLEANLIPRQVRSHIDGDLVNSTNRLRIIEVGTMPYMATKLVRTAIANNLIQAGRDAIQNLGRADNTTLMGFHAFDAAYLARLESINGLSMEQCVMKLLCMHIITSWDRNPDGVPSSNQVALYDPYTKLAKMDDADHPITVGQNNGPDIFGERCGGNACVLPYGGGSTGQLQFHVTLETVPIASRSNAIFIPASLLSSEGQNAGSALALFVAMWAQWPTMMWTVRAYTTDQPAGVDSSGYQYFAHALSTVMIPGHNDVHIVLPRRTTARNPTTETDLNSILLYRPFTGSRSSALYTDNTALNVAYVGMDKDPGYAITTKINLAQFLYTWALDLSPTVIALFMERLNDVTNIDQHVQPAMEKLSILGVRYPPMVSRSKTDPITVKQVENTDAFFNQQTPQGWSVRTTSIDFPMYPIRPDFLVCESDPLAWNQVCLGLASAPGLEPAGVSMNQMIGSPYIQYYSNVMARMIACTTTVHLSILGFDTTLWDSAFVNVNNRAAREIIRGTYIDRSNGLVPRGAKMSPLINALFTTMHDCSLSLDASGLTALDYTAPPVASYANIILGSSIKDELVPPPPYFVLNIVPVVLPDVWIHQTCRMVPRAFASIPPQNQSGSLVGLEVADMTALPVAGGGFGPMLRLVNQKVALGINETRDDNDAELWNTRMMQFTSTQMVMSDIGGRLIFDSPDAHDIVQLMPFNPDSSVERLSFGLAASSTFWIPRVVSDGRLQYPVVPRAAAIDLFRIQSGITTGRWFTWAVANIVSTPNLLLSADSAFSSRWLTAMAQNSTKADQGGDEASASTPSSLTAPATQ